MLYQDLVESYSKEPRDVHTIPLNREPIWFFTYVEKGFVYVRTSCIHSRSSRMKAPRKLNPAECKTMFELYVRRKNGERVSGDATRSSQNQVYWYGIFRDMEVKKQVILFLCSFPTVPMPNTGSIPIRCLRLATNE